MHFLPDYNSKLLEISPLHHVFLHLVVPLLLLWLPICEWKQLIL